MQVLYFIDPKPGGFYILLDGLLSLLLGPYDSREEAEAVMAALEEEKRLPQLLLAELLANMSEICEARDKEERAKIFEDALAANTALQKYLRELESAALHPTEEDDFSPRM